MKKRVLVVEDFDDNRLLMKLTLEHEGFVVIEASNGFQAVEKAVSEHPDVILMDIAMPVMDGIQATQAIRQHDELAGVPILVLTAYGDFYNDRARCVGCNAVIHKLVYYSELKPLVNRYIH